MPDPRLIPNERTAFFATAERALLCGGRDLGEGDRITIAASPEEPLVLTGEVETGGRDVLWLRLEPGPYAVQPWRSTWSLKVELPGGRFGVLGPETPELRISLPPGTPRWTLRAHPQVDRRPVARGAVPAGLAPVPVSDLAFARFSRQSSAADAPSTEACFALPTEVEDDPWFEVDLGALVYVDRVRLHLPPSASGPLHLTLYGFIGPDGGNMFPTPAWEHHGLAAEELSLPVGVEGRYLRVQRIGEGQALEVRALEAFGTVFWTQHPATTWQRTFALFAERPALATAPYSEWLTYAELWGLVRGVSAGLATRLLGAATGPEGQQFVGVCAPNSVEWVAVDLACVQLGLAVVPLATTDPPDVWEHVIEQCSLAAIVCTTDQAPEFQELAARRESLRLLITVNEGASARSHVDGPPAEASSPAPGAAAVVSFAELAATPPLPTAPTPGPSDALCAVGYTSGSTGKPKGAMRTFAAFHALMQAYNVVQPCVHISFQPPSHFSERIMLPVALVHGAQVGFSSGGARLYEDIGALRPTFLATVPRVFDVLRGTYEDTLRQALEGAPQDEHAAITERVRAEVRESLGGRLQSVAVGSAPCSEATLQFMRDCFPECLVSEGYGSTECGSITNNDAVMAGVDVKLIDVPELGYLTSDVPPRGEILVKTQHMITGYLNDPDNTAERFDDEGYFHTGDLGRRDPDGKVYVIGRRKNVIKLAQGEFVAPEAIETALEACEAVDQVFVYADGLQACVVALVHPAEGAPPAEVGGALTAGPLLDALRATGREARLLPFQVPAAIHVLAEPFTVENGLCTSSNKVNRGAVIERYAEAFAALYAAVDPRARPESLLEAVRRTAQDVLGQEVDAGADLSAHLGVDSLAGVDLVARLGARLGRDVPLQAFLGAGSLEEIAARLRADAGVGGGSSASGTVQQAEADLALEVPVDEGLPVAEGFSEVLLTGATGFLGVHLLGELLAAGARVRCLVRGDTAEAGLARLRDSASEAKLSGVDEAFASGRVLAVPGDLGAEGLGLDADTFQRLAAEVDCVVHAGAVVNWVMLYGQLRAANVLGTRELLRLAASGGRRTPFVFVSTISTVPTGRDETQAYERAAQLASGPYALSKWVAERLVARAGEAGLPVTIHRPSMITAHSRTGFSNQTDFVNRYLVGVLQLGRYLAEDAPFDMTPVDFVARAVVGLAKDGAARGRTLHLTNVHRSLSYRGLGEAIAACGHAALPTDYAAFRAALLADDGDEAQRNALLPLRAFFPARGFGLGMGPWPCDASEALLTERGISLPAPADQSLIQTTLDSLVQRGLLRSSS